MGSKISFQSIANLAAGLFGLVVSPGTPTGRFLRDDNSWQTVSGGGGSDPLVIDHPGLVATKSYNPIGPNGYVSGSAGSASVMRGFLFYLPQTATIASLGAYCSVAGGNAQFAIYNMSSTTKKPTTLVASTASVSVASTGSKTVTISPGSLARGWYWMFANVDTAATAFTSIDTAKAMPNQYQGAVSAANSYVVGISTPQTFGTWPADITSNTFTDVTTAVIPLVGYTVGSVP